LVGHAHLVEVLDTPIATGEHEYGVHGFENLIARRAADVLLVDLMRVGGVKDFMTVAAMAEDVGIDIVSHCFPEQSVQLLAAAGDVRFAEHSNWWSPLYNETLTINDGQYLIPDRPGFGFTFVDDVLERFRPEPHTS
jgi:L-alanine-DL-glutamate epimerase-like enolase superfamily enzyme